MVLLLHTYFLFCASFVLGQSIYNATENHSKYKGYGSDWIFYSDGSGVPTVGLLKAPGESLWRILYDVKTAVKFRLYTKNGNSEGQKISKDIDILKLTNFDPKKPVKGIIHGWLSSGSSDTCVSIKDSYLRNFDYNVIIVDWSDIASNYIYPIPMAHTKSVAEYYAELIDHLIQMGANPQDIHLIGHSLGAHISGFTGQLVKNGKLGRITGLDPAFPGFNLGMATGGRLSSTDAHFVDVIHSCAGVLGIPYPIGQVDFYPNGGYPPQPGCSGLPEMIEACSHGFSWRAFNLSINRQNDFHSHKCETWMDFLKGSCNNDVVLMGDPLVSTASGIYFLRTNL